jgi:hypothetical protein
MMISKRTAWLGILGAGLLLHSTVKAQSGNEDDYYSGPTPLGVSIGVRGGIVLSTARGGFPSLLIGEISDSTGEVKGSGEISESLAESGTGNRFTIAALIPFSEKCGLDLEFGMLRYAAQYKGDATRQPTKLDVQTLLLGVGGEYSFYSDPRSYQMSGLRSVYAAGGFDITLATLANRVESTSYSSTGEPVAAVGSFDNSEPFNALVALRAGVGIRFAADPHFEIMTEASYGYALNTVFSKNSVPDTDFTVDNMAVVAGVGYRF